MAPRLTRRVRLRSYALLRLFPKRGPEGADVPGGVLEVPVGGPLEVPRGAETGVEGLVVAALVSPAEEGPVVALAEVLLTSKGTRGATDRAAP
eukprot:2759541-Pyramimonas_sp.AAC.1